MPRDPPADAPENAMLECILWVLDHGIDLGQEALPIRGLMSHRFPILAIHEAAHGRFAKARRKAALPKGSSGFLPLPPVHD